MATIPLTRRGADKLKEELHRLKSVERHAVIQAIAEARSHGDLSENAEYHSAKEAQGLNEAKVADLEDKLSRADIIDVTKLKGDQVMFGATAQSAVPKAYIAIVSIRVRVRPMRSQTLPKMMPPTAQPTRRSEVPIPVYCRVAAPASFEPIGRPSSVGMQLDET